MAAAVVLYAFVVASVVGAVLNMAAAVLKLAYVTVVIVVYIFSEGIIAVFRIFVFRHTCLSFVFRRFVKKLFWLQVNYKTKNILCKYRTVPKIRHKCARFFV